MSISERNIINILLKMSAWSSHFHAIMHYWHALQRSCTTTKWNHVLCTYDY